MNNSIQRLRSTKSRLFPVIIVSIGAILLLIIGVVVTIVPRLFTPQKTTTTMTKHTSSVVADSPQLFGSNLVYSSGQAQQLTSLSTYTLLQQLHVQFLRIPILPDNDATTLTYIDQKVHALNITPVVVLRGPSFPQALAANKNLVQTTTKTFGTSTVYYEYGTDDDVLVSTSDYVSSWNSTIPQLKKLAPNAKFLGPATSQYNHATLETFLQHAQPTPDAISWHEFSCTATSGQEACLQGLSNWTSYISDARQIMNTTVHKTLPIMITEWNYAANANSADGKSNDNAFLTNWTIQAIDTLAKNDVFAAMQYASNGTTTALINQQNQLTTQGNIFKTQYELHVLQANHATTATPLPTSAPVSTPTPKVASSPTTVPTLTPAVVQATVPPTVPTPSPTPISSGTKPLYSFEDGGTDKWFADFVTSLVNSTDYASDGTHSLKVTIKNMTNNDYPMVFTNNWDGPPQMPQAGQTISLDVYIPRGSPTTQIGIFVEDQAGTQYFVPWNQYGPEPQGSWQHLTYRVPAGVSEYGVGLHTASTAPQTVVAYIDAVNW